MLTKELIKETLSRRFVEIIAGRNGFKCQKPDPDSGVDLSITKSIIDIRFGERRILDTGEYLEIQLKSTTDSSIIYDEDCLKYDLEAKTFNDLVFRLQSNSLTPLYLILFILPDEENQWVEITEDALKLRKRAYWYIPSSGESMTPNTSKKRISIPLSQVVDLEFLERCFVEAYG